MNRLLIAVIFIIITVSIGVVSLFYINNTHEDMTTILDTALESATADNKADAKAQISHALSQWEKKDDILNVLLGQIQTNDVKSSLKMASYFAEIGDIESVIIYINECKVELERIKNSNTPSISTIL